MKGETHTRNRKYVLRRPLVLHGRSQAQWSVRKQCDFSEIVHIACLWGNVIGVGESGTLVPPLTSAASAPWRPSHAGQRGVQ